MTYLCDTDHITILQRETGDAFTRLQARLAQVPPPALAVPIISLHEQVLGCHTYINQARPPAALGPAAPRGHPSFQRNIFPKSGF